LSVPAVLATNTYVEDFKGNKYKTVQLDGKTWLAENLNSLVGYGSWCDNCDEYGAFYTFEAAKKACGTLDNGWRLPNNDEWNKLREKYKEPDTIRYTDSYERLLVGGNSGFHASGGYFKSSDDYSKEQGGYWSLEGDKILYYHFFSPLSGYPDIHHSERYYRPEVVALSCRCVK